METLEPGNVETVKGRLSRAPILVLVFLTAMNAWSFVDSYLLPAVQPLIQTEFHISDTQLGAITSWFIVVYSLALLPLGKLGDKVSTVRIISGCGILWSLTMIATANTHSYHALSLSYSMVGIGEAGFSVFAPILLTDLFPLRSLTWVLAVFYTAPAVGAAAGYGLGSRLAQNYGWHTAFRVSAIPGLVIALVVLFLFRNLPQLSQSHTSRVPFRKLGSQLLHNRIYVFHSVSYAFVVFALGAFQTWLPTLMMRRFHFSLEVAGMRAGVVTLISGIVGTLLGGLIAQRWLRRNPAALSLFSAWATLASVPFCLLTIYGSESWAVPSALLMLLCICATIAPQSAVVLHALPPDGSRPRALLIAALLSHVLGDAISPVLTGFLSDHIGLRLAVALSAIPLFVAGAMLLVPLPPPLLELEAA